MKCLILAAILLGAAVQAQTLAEGLYKITCIKNGNLLNIEDKSSSNGANLILYPFQDDPTLTNQYFYLEYADNKWATLVSKYSNKALTVAGETTGTTYTQQTTTGLPEQLFSVTVAKDGNYIIKNKKTGLAMNCNTEKFTNINNRFAVQEVRDCNDGEKFTFIKTGELPTNA